MLTVTVADLVYRYRQFLIAVLGAGLVLAMALLLAGMAAGFGVEVHRTVGAVNADRWVMASSSNGRLTATDLFPESDTALIATTRGVSGDSPLVVLPQQVAQVRKSSKTVVLIGVQVGGAAVARPRSGSPLSGNGQVVVDSAIGARTGGNLLVDGRSFRVVGTVSNRTLLGGVPVVYLTLPDAQRLVLNGRPEVSAIATTGIPTSVPHGLQVFTNAAVEHDTLTVLSSAISSINGNKEFMWVIAAIIVSALLYVSALQRSRDFAVLKALGSSTTTLFVSLATQAVIVTVLAAGFAAIVCNFMKGIFQLPVVIPDNAFATLPLVAVVVGILSSLVALRRATKVDPAAAFES